MRVLVTGADGFVGSWLVPHLLELGHEVVAAIRPDVLRAGAHAPVPTVALELTDAASVAAALTGHPEAVVHLAAVSSGSQARVDPGAAWEVNAAGTARLADALGRRRAAGEGDPLLLVVSTGEVYGRGPARPRIESDPTVPCTPYGASKLGAEVAALEVHRRTGLRVVVARAFPHTGRGQDDRFLVPAFARRLQQAKRAGARTVAVGNLEPVREFLHVSDVVAAYGVLLQHGASGTVYNVAGGGGIGLGELYARLARLVGSTADPVTDPTLIRPADLPYLVGDGARLRAATGWQPRISLDQTLAEVVDAQAN